MSSAEVSRSIYEELRAEGLASRTTADWDRQTVDRIESLLVPGQRVLDAGCGYGRIAVPLAAAGWEVVGVDISEHMLQEARQAAHRAEVDIDWHLGDICQMPLAGDSFDVVLCMWLTFNELLQRAEQLAALREMCRVLRPGGWALIDGPPFSDSIDPADMEAPCDVDESELQQTPVAMSFRELMDEVGIARHDLFIDSCPGRPRFFLRFWKE